jgi:hypothetical protein
LKLSKGVAWAFSKTLSGQLRHQGSVKQHGSRRSVLFGLVTTAAMTGACMPTPGPAGPAVARPATEKPPASDPGPGGGSAGTNPGAGGAADPEDPGGGAMSGGRTGSGGSTGSGGRSGSGGQDSGGRDGSGGRTGAGGAAGTPGAGGPTDAGAGPAGSVTILAAGDMSASWGEQVAVAKMVESLVKEKPIAAILTLGDHAYDDAGNSRTVDFKNFYTPTWGQPAFKAITRPSMGNHEYDVSQAKDYFDYFNGAGKNDGPAGERGKGYYSFDLGAWHLIALNTGNDCGAVPCGSGSAQITWLKADLAATSARCVLAYMHYPRFNEGNVHAGEVGVAKTIFDTLYDAGVDVVLAAHEHSYQQFKPANKAGQLDMDKGIRTFVQGAGGADLFAEGFGKQHAAIHDYNQNKQYGVLEMTLNADTYAWRFVNAGGQAMVSGMDRCH